MPKSVLTLGTFDGVHRGHQAILRRVVRCARTLGARSVALAFDMPPRHSGDRRPDPILLTTWDEKRAILRRLGIDHVEALHFTPQLARTEPETFFKETLVRKWKAVEIIVGPRVAFGKNRRGRLRLLRQLGRCAGVRVHVVPSVAGGNVSVASRRIRAALKNGNVERAAALLGYPYSVAGPVVHGEGRGRVLGYPTANIETSPRKILPPGVFWVKVIAGPRAASAPTRAQWRSAVDGLCNVGRRPTFNRPSAVTRCEVFLFHNPGPLYGRSLRIFFLKHLRPEKRFRSAADLVRQINQDFSTAKKWAVKKSLHLFSLPFS